MQAMEREKQGAKQRFLFVLLLKAIAAFLITNSHMDDYYPISQLATGGAIGDGIFFIVSGFCFSAKKDTFGSFVKKKLLRIYPGVLIATLVLSILGGYGLRLTFANYVFPTTYWFVECILVYYLLLFLLEKSKLLEHPAWLYGALLVVYFVWYQFINKEVFSVEKMEISGHFKFVIYFMIMVSGYYLRQNVAKIKTAVQGKGKALLGLFFAMVLLFYVVKLVLERNTAWMWMQFIHQYINLGIACLAVVCGIAWEDTLGKLQTCKVWKAVKFVAEITLEIYLLQYFALEYFPLPAVFPLNILVIIVVLLASAKLLHHISEKISAALIAVF